MPYRDRARTRREFLRQAGVGLAAMALPSGLRAATERRRPNVLVLFTDDQRFDTLNALGNPHVRTPNLDRLVQRGTAFTHAFIQGSTVGAVCVCSRSTLMTGRHLYHSPLQPRESDGLTLWPEAFRGAGYTTFGTGKWHNGPWAYSRCFSRGDSIFFGGMSDHLNVPIHDFDPTGAYPASGRRTAEGFSSEVFSDAAIRFLREYRDEAPFFAYVSYTAPHDPRMAPAEYTAMYPPDRLPLPGNFLPEHPFDNGEMRIRDEKLAPWPRTPEVVREHLAAYYAMITHADAQIGRVLDALEESGRAEDTLVLFAGDNGLAVGQHGLMGKQSLYEHSVRVPLVVAGPGVPRGRRSDALVYLHDLFPTTCDLAGLQTPATVESTSLAPVLSGEKERVRGSVFAGHASVQRMVRTEEWKLIRYPYVGKTQLFHVSEDPWERRDLSEDRGQAGRIRELEGELKRWQRVTGDTLDLENPPRRPGQGIPVKPGPDGTLTLTPEAARTRGSLRYQKDRENLGGWTDPRDFPEWDLVDVKPGTYAVEFTYGSMSQGAEYTLVAGDRRLACKTSNTGGLRTYQICRVGTIELAAGKVTLAIRPEPFKGALMNFRLLILKPVAP